MEQTLVVLQQELYIHQARYQNDEYELQMLRFWRLLEFPLTLDSDICTNVAEHVIKPNNGVI